MKSYDVLPALAVRGKALRQSLRLVTIGWMWGVVWMTCVSGDQMRAFAKILGFNDFAFGLFGAIPFIATLAQLPAAILVERTGLRKYPFMGAQLVARLLWIPIALIPFVFDVGRDGSPTAVIVMLSIFAISNFLANFATPPWMTWMADLIPRRIRGRFFARRAQLTTIVQIVVIIVISLILVSLSGGSRGQENAVDQQTLLRVICVIFLIAAVFGVLDILTFRYIREIFQSHDVSQKAAAEPALQFNVSRGRGALAGATYPFRFAWRATWEILVEPLKTNRVFRNYVCYGAAITFTATIGGWYFWLQSREVLGFNSLATNILFLAIGPMAAVMTAGWWGKLIDRFGRRPVLIIATIGTMLSAMPWFFATRNTPSPMFVADAVNWLSVHAGMIFGRENWIILGAEASQLVGAYLLVAAGCLVGGSSWTGIGLAQNAIILGFSDGTGRSKYVAASSVLVNFGGAAGGIVGGIVAQKFNGLDIMIGPFLLNNYTLTFAISIVVRLISLGWLHGMPDPGSRKVRDLFRYWGENTYNIVTSRLFYPLRFFGWGRSENCESRSASRKLDDNSKNKK